MNACSSMGRVGAREKGFTLLVAVVLLLLAGLMTALALNVGVFEQRSSGNDLRAKLVHEVAEAGVAQGFEFLLRANPTWVDDAARWELCLAADDTFPCGAVPPSRRGSMFRLKAGGHTVDGLAADLTKFMLALPSPLPAAGAFDTAYGVAPVLCRVPNPVSAASIECATDMTNLSDRRVVTFVSVAQVRGDTGRTTLTQTVSRSSLLAAPGGVPAIAASGTVNPPGSGDIVAMADAAGPGLDISIWSRLEVKPSAGAFGTCSRTDFLRSGLVSLTDADWVSDRVCDGCSCDKAKHAAEPEGWDILDNDGGAEGINNDVKPEEFPCDLFEFAFGVKSWKDDVPKDHFCETRMPTVAFTTPAGTVVQMYPDEAFLYTYASKIKATDDNADFVREDQRLEGNLSGTDSGLAWCQVNCLPNNGPVGSVANPVAVVLDTGGQIHAEIFGLLFVRSTGAGPLVAATGGNAAIKFNGQSRIFGSVLVQGEVETGSAGLIFGDKDVIWALANDPKMARFDTLHGGWTDRHSY